MSLPGIVQSTLGDEDVVDRVSLGGEDALFATPTRTLVYRAEGLLSDESVEEYPHGAERVAVSEGRRKAKVSLDYGLEGERTLSLPTRAVDGALSHLLAGTLRGTGVVEDDETVRESFRFSELTLVVTDARVVKHVGTAVWDDDFEEFDLGDVTDLAFEDGSVATSVVLTLGDRQERFKAPNEQARRVRESLERALFEFHGVADYESFRAAAAPPEPDADADASGASTADPADAAGGRVDFGEGPDPLSTNPRALSEEPANATRAGETRDEPESSADGGAGATPGGADRAAGTATDDSGTATGAETETSAETETETGTGAARDADAADGFDGSGFRVAADDAGGGADDASLAAVETELRELREAIEAHSERLDRQDELLRQLIEELRQGR
jgi:hypothetical protein